MATKDVLPHVVAAVAAILSITIVPQLKDLTSVPPRIVRISIDDSRSRIGVDPDTIVWQVRNLGDSTLDSLNVRVTALRSTSGCTASFDATFLVPVHADTRKITDPSISPLRLDRDSINYRIGRLAAGRKIDLGAIATGVRKKRCVAAVPTSRVARDLRDLSDNSKWVATVLSSRLARRSLTFAGAFLAVLLVAKLAMTALAGRLPPPGAPQPPHRRRRWIW
jgi:hypothetical protein